MTCLTAARHVSHYRNYSVPPSVCRAEARRGLPKRAREDRDPNEYVGHHKHARTKQSNDNNQTEVLSGNANKPAVPLHPAEGELDTPNTQTDRSLVDPFDNNDCHDYPGDYQNFISLTFSILLTSPTR
ncbi:hypothetical protein EDD15DRAFT_2378122 [Pisolithus albus]|nr:hypothetical protein EDD15DRAFT_2378122 [Pisolithus albus]